MRITVLAGSPKGETSVTMQYARYLERYLRGHEVRIHHVALRARALERSEEAFAEVLADVRSSELVLWAFPLYIGLVPSGYKRFIELVAERGAVEAFAGRHAATLSTSIHFHDNTAHDYVRGVSEDWGMRFLGSFSPAMHDLATEEGERRLRGFGDLLVEGVLANAPAQRLFAPLPASDWSYRPGPVGRRLDAAGLRVLILTDARPGTGNAAAMTDRLAGAFGDGAEVVNLWDVDIRGACLGCLRCAQANRCAYTGKDGFLEFYETKVRAAELLVFVGAAVDRHLSSRWRLFFERSFYYTHTPSLQGKQLLVAVAGPLGHLANLREVLSSYAQWQELNLAGMVSDERADAGTLDALLDGAAAAAVRLARRGYVAPADFLGVGGLKIFRDDIYGKLRWVFRADHRYYARHGYYDFPTRRWGQRAFNAAMGGVFRLPRARREFEKQMKQGMIRELRKVVERAGEAGPAGPAGTPAIVGGNERAAPV
jgi:multimeric flavodoxin WrbA